MRFQDQIVLVTGGSRGIGRAIVTSFIQEGAKVISISRTLPEEKTPGVLYLQGDISKSSYPEKALKEIEEKYKRLDILCHNAGIYPLSRIEDMSLEEWEKVLSTNLTSTFLFVKASIPLMKRQNFGRIVITSSISGPKVGLPGVAHYTASKAGVDGFMKTAAIELAKYNITINAVAPGSIITEGLNELSQEHMQNMLRAVPLGRLGTPEDVAHAILFLASKEASYITGHSLVIDGGQTLPESHFLEY